MFPATRDYILFVLMTACLLTLASYTTAQDGKSSIASKGGRDADAPRVRRVLILHSFGRNFAPFTAVSSTFRAELAQQSAEPIEFLEASLESTLFAEASS